MRKYNNFNINNNLKWLEILLVKNLYIKLCINNIKILTYYILKKVVINW